MSYAPDSAIHGWHLTFTIEHLDGRLPEGLSAVVATVPRDFWGLDFAIAGYFLGQILSPPRLERE